MGIVTPRFNLIDEPWIPVTDDQQEDRLLSIRETFAGAAGLRRLSGDLPTQDFAILRLLTAILLRASSREANSLWLADIDEWWLDAIESGELDLEAINQYLDEHHDRFWLLHTECPFAQVANLATAKGEHAGIERLVADAESAYFTSRSGTKLDSLSYPEAARWLLHAQAYDYSGIKPAAIGDRRAKGGRGYPIGTGAAGAGGAVVLHGSNLLETLLLNLPLRKIDESIDSGGDTVRADLPFWELSPQTAAARAVEASIPAGPIDALTWQSRRIRLYADEQRVTGVLITNGDKLELKNNFADPFFGFQYSKNLSGTAGEVYLAKKHYSERTFWRGVESLLYRHSALSEAVREKNPLRLPENIAHLAKVSESSLEALPQRVDVELVGMEYGTQDSVISDIIHVEIPLALRVLTTEGSLWSEAIIQNVRATLDAASALGSFAGMLVQAAGGTYAHDADATREVLAALETEFRGWLLTASALAPSIALVGQWRRTARRTILAHADALVRDAGPQALQGRFTAPKSESGPDSAPRLQSAGTARIWLLAQLKKSLRLPSQEEEKSQ